VESAYDDPADAPGLGGEGKLVFLQPASARNLVEKDIIISPLAYGFRKLISPFAGTGSGEFLTQPHLWLPETKSHFLA